MGRLRVWREQLLLGSRQAPISMGFGARLPGTKLTFFPWLSATSGARHRQCLFIGDSHVYIMRVYSAARWSILNSAFKREPEFLERCENRIRVLQMLREQHFLPSSVRTTTRSPRHPSSSESQSWFDSHIPYVGFSTPGVPLPWHDRGRGFESPSSSQILRSSVGRPHPSGAKARFY